MSNAIERGYLREKSCSFFKIAGLSLILLSFTGCRSYRPSLRPENEERVTISNRGLMGYILYKNLFDVERIDYSRRKNKE
jgi:hypothetical protein